VFKLIIWWLSLRGYSMFSKDSNSKVLMQLIHYNNVKVRKVRTEKLIDDSINKVEDERHLQRD
jgi:hypothetical protein